jgi:hypothetical protein
MLNDRPVAGQLTPPKLSCPGADTAGMTFTSPLTRTEPPRTNPELAALNSWLDYNRATLLGKLDGLTEEQAGQPMVGSGTTLHGLVRHMTTMEQFFLVECVGGQVEPYPYYDGEEVDWDWELDRSEGLQADVDRYVALCERARAITADVDPDTAIVTKRGNTVDIRWVMLGQIQEYARHNGHADILRELIDGTTGE